MRKLAAMLLGLVPALAGAAEYHVTVDGDDRSAGTAAAPWATLQHAVDSVQAGDVVHVHAGSYLGARIEVSGAEGSPITLAAVPGDTVLLTAPGAENEHDSTLEIETWEAPEVVAWWIVEGFEIEGGARSGIDLRHIHDVVVRDNVVHDSGLTGIFTAFADDVEISGNTSFGNGEHGIYWSNSGDRPVIRGNRLHDNAAAGVHMNADVSQGGDGVITGALVEKNVIHGNGTAGGAGVNMDGVSRSAVVNNLIYDEHAGGITLYRIDGAVCSSDNLIAHNTVLTAEDGRWALQMPDPGCTGNRLVDNVFWTDHPFRGSISVWTAAPPGFESHHNAVMDRFSVDGGDTVISLAQWQALGHGEDSLLTDPAVLFVDPATGDFHLAPGSPAIDSGETLPEVTSDLEDRPRPQGLASDLGCYEAGDGIFDDGWESGDTSAWDVTAQ